MQTTVPEWQHLAIYAVGAALIVMLLQRIPFVGRILRFAISLGLMAFLIFILLSEAPYQPELSRFADRLGLDDQQVAGGELRVPMASDGHFWVVASINGVRARMLIDSGATITALSRPTARAAKVGTGTGLAPIVLQTANGAAPAEAGKVEEIRVGNIIARNLRIVSSPGLGNLDVLGMNFLSKLQSWRVEDGTLILVPHHPQPTKSREDAMRLSYAIKFVNDMDAAMAFYRDALGLTPAFQSPFWSEFDTGETKLALHPASDENPAGTVQLGLSTTDIDNFYAAGQAEGLVFTSPPTDIHGTRIARFRDLDGAEISVSGA